MKLNFDKNDLFFLKIIDEEMFSSIFPEFKKKEISALVTEYYEKKTVFKMINDSDIRVYFKDKKIVQINITPSKEDVNKSDFELTKSFEKYNCSIIELFGSPLLGSFGMNMKWKIGSISIKHYIFERFSFEERIEITF